MATLSGKSILRLLNLTEAQIGALDDLSSLELGAVNGITAGTVTASKAVVVDSNKDIGDFRNVDVVNLDAGADAVAGTVDVFPATTASGKMILAAVNSAGAFNTTISNASMGQSTVVSIPDPGAATANFVLNAGTATIAGAKTFSSGVTINPTTNQLVLGVTNTTTISAVAPSASRVCSIQDFGGAANFVLADAVNHKVDGVAMSNVKWVDVTVTAALLDAAGTAPVIAGVTGDQYKIREVRLVGGGTSFAAGGDRLISLTDGTTVWTTIANADIESAPAATLHWGDTKVPYLTGTSDTASASNAAIRFQYSGGTTDHSATGSIKFSVCLEKVA